MLNNLFKLNALFVFYFELNIITADMYGKLNIHSFIHPNLLINILVVQ